MNLFNESNARIRDTYVHEYGVPVPSELSVRAPAELLMNIYRGIKNFTVDQYKALFAKVKAGTITIDNDPTGAETKTYSNVTVDFVE